MAKEKELSRFISRSQKLMYVCILRAEVQPTLDPYTEAFL